MKRLVILERKVSGLTESALDRFAQRARRTVGLKGTVNVLVTGSTALRALNRRYRRKDKATDVLSFPSLSLRSMSRLKIAGDIAVCADIASQNARLLGHSAAEEVKVLVLHGILHLAGFDHEQDNGEMARKELRLRRKLNLPIGLIERARATGDRRMTTGRKSIGRRKRSER